MTQKSPSAETPQGEFSAMPKIRATRLVTPGGRARKGAATESATENKPPARNAPLRRLKGKPYEPPVWAVPPARVKRWGKSPPRGWQHSRHGKPRVEQGQIGGEGRPGPLGPSGRLLESRSDSGPRGMIAGARKRSTESGLQVHPPLTSYNSIRFAADPAASRRRPIRYQLRLLSGSVSFPTSPALKRMVADGAVSER